MKRFLTVLLVSALCIVCFVCVVSANSDKQVHVTFNGEVINCENYGQPAVIVNDRTLVPLRAIFEALGAEVEWDDATRTVTATKGQDTVKLTIDDTKLYKNGQPVYELHRPLVVRQPG